MSLEENVNENVKPEISAEKKEENGNGENREELVKEYISTEASPLTAAACGQVDDVFEPSETRLKICAALDILSGKRETTIARKHSVK